MKWDETGLALEKPSRDCARVDFPLPYIYEMRECPRISGYGFVSESFEGYDTFKNRNVI